MFRHIRENYLFYIVAFIIVLPLFALCCAALIGKSDAFGFLISHVVDDVLMNSFIISLFTSLGVLIIGIGTAWFVTQYSFLGRNIFEWALFMPLAFPAYILAYVYTDFFDEAGLFAQYLNTFGLGFFIPDFRTVWGASFILTFCLYPYIYLFARNGFLAGFQSQIEAASLLNASKWSQFWDIALPLARPFIIVGLMLVMMEVLADYGTMDYFGIRVFSTMIYDSWAGYGDIVAASRLSLILLGFVLMLVFFEKKQRGKMKFDTAHSLKGHNNLQKREGLLIFCFCMFPVLFGFIMPFMMMVQMVFETIDLQIITQTIPYLFNTLFLSLSVATVGIVIAFTLTILKRKSPNGFKNILFSFCGFGYALPGIILGLGILLISSLFTSLGILVTGTLTFLIIGYLIRFLNVALHGVDSGFEKINPSMMDAGMLMQHTKFDNLWHVKLPLLWPSMLSAGLILAIEVIKELPLTLILRPFDFDTLAVRTYHLASDERLAEASFPALCIVLAGCIPVFLLKKLAGNPQ